MPRRTRILITRTREQASVLASRLDALGAETISVPTIELKPPASFANLDAALSAAAQGTYDCILFTSVNAAKLFYRRAVETGTALHSCRIAVIGPATASAVLETGLPHRGGVLMPREFVAESLLRSLLEEADGRLQRYLLVRAEEARDILPEGLRAAGHHVTVAAAYRNVVPEGSVGALRELFASQTTQPDIITFTSSSTASNFFALMKSARLAVPARVALASIGPITSQTLRELGHEPDLEAAEPTIESLVECIWVACIGGVGSR